jgi:polysaccharide pyruvyl transferase WcaK-like protein
MRVVVIGDVGVVDGMLHVGDEAMFDALVDALLGRGVGSIVGISNAPAETAERYGIEAVGRIGFSGPRADMRARFDRVLRCSAGERALPVDDPVWPVIDAVSGADAVAVAGGGNLASNWPTHVFERAALGAIAERTGRPLVVTGQTLGPRLDPADRELVATLLRSARLVGVREHASADVARRLGVTSERVVANRDDASFLGAGDVEHPGGSRRPHGMILVSLSVHLGGLRRAPTVAGLAAALDGLAARSGLRVVFHPHFGSLDPGRLRGDEVLHDEVRDRMTTDAELLRVGTPRTAAMLARRAAMLVTSRYHPAVFAGPAGVPIAALAADDYTAVKLRGATGWWDQRGVLDLADAASPGDGGTRLVRAWDDRQAAREAAARLRGEAERAASAWFDRVAGALGGDTA